jgi:hypothetical protein
MKKSLFIAIVLAFFFLSGLAAAKLKEGDTIGVPRDYATIQEAIDAAALGVIIEVASGEYYENLTFSNKSI